MGNWYKSTNWSFDFFLAYWLHIVIHRLATQIRRKFNLVVVAFWWQRRIWSLILSLFSMYLVPKFEREKILGCMQRIVPWRVLFINMIFIDSFIGEFAQRIKRLKISFSLSYLHWQTDMQNCTKSRRTLRRWKTVAKKNFLGCATITGIIRR